jgi:dTDP-4-amino-4,6-dideoxygalactose transaminase
LYARLKEAGIFGRRYFYPLISEFPMYRSLPSAQATNLPVATSVARQILCLPIYPDLDDSVPERVAAICVACRGLR